MHLYYDRSGIPIDFATWKRLHGDLNYLRVARTTVSSAADLAKTFDVSTVWLGIDHGFTGSPPPILFETMVFGLGSDEELCRRYATEAEARAGHTEVVVTVAATLDDPIVMDIENVEEKW